MLITRAPCAAAQSSALEDVERGAFRAGGFRIEGAHREDFCVRRRSHQLAVRCDQAGDRRSVLVRGRGCRKRIERTGDRAGELGVVSVDAGIDDRHQDVIALCEGMCLWQAQFGELVLRGVACGPGFVLLQHEQVIRLRRRHEAIGLELAHDCCDRAPAGNTPAIQRGAGKLERLAFDDASAGAGVAAPRSAVR